MNISFKSGIQDIMQVRNTQLKPYRFNIYKNVEEFKLYNITNRFIDTFFVYLSKAEIIMAATGTYDIDTVAQSRFGLGVKDEYEWQAIFDRIYTGEILSIPDVAGRAESLWYFQSLPIEYARDNLGTVAVKINREEVYNIIKEAEQADGMLVFIIDSNNNVLF